MRWFSSKQFQSEKKQVNKSLECNRFDSIDQYSYVASSTFMCSQWILCKMRNHSYKFSPYRYRHTDRDTHTQLCARIIFQLCKWCVSCIVLGNRWRFRRQSEWQRQTESTFVKKIFVAIKWSILKRVIFIAFWNTFTRASTDFF